MIKETIKAYADLIAAVVIIAAVVWALWAVYNRGYNSADDKWQIKWGTMLAEQMEANFKAETNKRARETHWQNLFDEASKNAQEKINDLEADLIAASVSADGLRDEARAYANRARRCSETAGAATERETATDPFILFADLLSELEQEGRRYAKEADRRGIAGTACQNAYTSLEKKPTQ